MKISKQLFLHSDGAYLKIHLTLNEKKWFATNHQFKIANCRWGDSETKESDMLYVKIKDRHSDFSVSALQQILIGLLSNEVISLKDSNELMKSACILLDSMVPHFKKHERFFKIAEKANLTKIVIDTVDHEEIKLAPSEKFDIENKLKHYFALLNECPASIAIRILDACDNDTDSPYDKKWLWELIHQLKTYIKALSPDAADYVHHLLKKQIREISLSEDVMSLAFNRSDTLENIIQLMNILWRARNRDRDQQMIKGDFYDDVDHVKALHYFLNEKNMTPKQALNQILNLGFIKTNSLVELYDHGLRKHHLFSYQGYYKNFSNFQEVHGKALSYLIKQKHFSPDEVMKEINELTEDQVEALLELFDEGLRGEHLRAWREGHHIPISEGQFSDAHRFTLIYLVREQHLTPAEAMKELHELSGPAANAIYVFYALGLRGADLRAWREKEQFDSRDYGALCAWIDLRAKEEDISIDKIFEEMRKMPKKDIHDVMMGLKSPPELKGYSLSR